LDKKERPASHVTIIKTRADQPAQGRTDFGSLDWCAQDFAADSQERRTD
jgi:hypothetical protein